MMYAICFVTFKLMEAANSSIFSGLATRKKILFLWSPKAIRSIIQTFKRITGHDLAGF